MNQIRRLINIAEAYAYGFKSMNGDICDVFLKPSRKEWREAIGNHDNVRAIIDGEDIYVWNSDGALHQMVWQKLQVSDHALPVIIHGQVGGPAEVLVSDYVYSGRVKWKHDDERIVSAIQNNNWMSRNFSSIDVMFMPPI